MTNIGNAEFGRLLDIQDEHTATAKWQRIKGGVKIGTAHIAFGGANAAPWLLPGLDHLVLGIGMAATGAASAILLGSGVKNTLAAGAADEKLTNVNQQIQVFTNPPGQTE